MLDQSYNLDNPTNKANHISTLIQRHGLTLDQNHLAHWDVYIYLYIYYIYLYILDQRHNCMYILYIGSTSQFVIHQSRFKGFDLLVGMITNENLGTHCFCEIYLLHKATISISYNVILQC